MLVLPLSRPRAGRGHGAADACGAQQQRADGCHDMVGISTETGNKLWDWPHNTDEANLNLIPGRGIAGFEGVEGTEVDSC